MSASKYGSLLTIILIVLIVVILAGAGLLVYNYVIKPKRDSKQKFEAIEEFDRTVITDNNNDNDNEQEETDGEFQVAGTENQNNNNGTQSKTSMSKKTYFKGFVMLGYITIPKTNVKEPILNTVTPETLNTAVAVLYPNNAQLNKPGNVVIIGHNYRNGTFFSNNNKLSVGDRIQIKDNSGTELVYTIYQKFQTTENDTSFYDRDTNGAIEVTLSTCTDDSKERIVILARVEE